MNKNKDLNKGIYMGISFIIVVVCMLFIFLNILEAKAHAEDLSEIMPKILEFDELTEEEISKEKYYRILDEDEELITTMGRRVYVDDEYITSDNEYYRVYKVEEYTAYARLIEKLELAPPENIRERETSGENAPLPGAKENDIMMAQGEDGVTRAIAIYHTHNAESFVPTDGTHSIDGQGGIHEVGRAFQRALEDKGIRAIFSEDLHTPHDAGAYRRSRQTVLELLEQEPDAIFDIHRDSAPPGEYATAIEGVPATKILMVVGRQNPNMEVTRQFALDLKYISDQIHPDLIKGVMMAQGNYNQDLTPLNLLLEVGGHTNTREAAEHGITFFSNSVGHYFYGTEAENNIEEIPPGGKAAERPLEEGHPIWLAIIRIIALAAVAGAAFFLLNVGTYDNFKEKYGSGLSRYKEKLITIWDRVKNRIR